jgi:hypothetical protein
MSENMTPAEGNGTLSVDGAANAMLGLMGGEDSEEQPVAEQEEQVEAEATEDSYEVDESEDEVGEEEQEQEQPKYRVKVSGEELEVTLDELVNGYQREADYTKKTQTLAEARKNLEQDKASVEQAKQLRDQYSQRLQLVEQMLSQQPQEDLQLLKETDPIGYAVRVAEQQQNDKQLAAIQMERNRIAQMQQSEQRELLQQHVAVEAEKLTQAIPELASPEKGETVRKEIRQFAKSIGWTDQELASVYDSRAVMTLYKAMQYDRLVSKRPEISKKVSQAPKMIRSGASVQRSPEQEQTNKLRQKLRNSGRVADAANLFEKFI